MGGHNEPNRLDLFGLTNHLSTTMTSRPRLLPLFVLIGTLLFAGSEKSKASLIFGGSDGNVTVDITSPISWTIAGLGGPITGQDFAFVIPGVYSSAPISAQIIQPTLIGGGLGGWTASSGTTLNTLPAYA